MTSQGLSELGNPGDLSTAGADLCPGLWKSKAKLFAVIFTTTSCQAAAKGVNAALTQPENGNEPVAVCDFLLWEKTRPKGERHVLRCALAVSIGTNRNFSLQPKRWLNLNPINQSHLQLD